MVRFMMLGLGLCRIWVLADTLASWWWLWWNDVYSCYYHCGDYLHSVLIGPSGICIYYHEWNRPLNTLSDDIGEERRLMFGMLYSIQVWEKAGSHCRNPCPSISYQLNLLEGTGWEVEHFPIDCRKEPYTQNGKLYIYCCLGCKPPVHNRQCDAFPKDAYALHCLKTTRQVSSKMFLDLAFSLVRARGYRCGTLHS